MRGTAVTFVTLPDILLAELPSGMRHHFPGSLLVAGCISDAEGVEFFENDKTLLFEHLLYRALSSAPSTEGELSLLQQSLDKSDGLSLLARTVALMTPEDERDALFHKWAQEIAADDGHHSIGRYLRPILNSWLLEKFGSVDKHTLCENISNKYLRV